MAKQNAVKHTKDDINRYKNHTAEMIKSTYVFAFTVFVFIELILEYYLYPLLPTGIWRLLIIAGVDAGLYIAVYNAVKLGYNKFIEHRKPKYDIEGTWYHLHLPHSLGTEDYDRSTIRAGETEIVRDLYDFAMEGNNYDYTVNETGEVCRNEANHTSWYTELSEISDSGEFDIIQVYKASSNVKPLLEIKTCPCCNRKIPNGKTITVKEADPTRYGIHKFKIDLKHNRINGSYSDCWPSLKTGELILFRSREARDKRIQQFFKARKEAMEKMQATV